MTLEAIYARIPPIACQRKCQEACGPIGMSRVEFVRIMGREPAASESFMDHPMMINPVTGGCPKLGRDGACMVYDKRPAVCRLFGVVPEMPCPFGCVPERILTDAEARAILRDVEEIGR